MKDAIGQIDYEILDSNDFELLYYLFPLIEKMIIDILKYNVDSDIEIYTQGTYRTLDSVIAKDDNKKHFDDEIIYLLKKYYGKNGLRNKLFHYRGDKIILQPFDIKIIKGLALRILKQYKRAINKSNKYSNISIELM